MSYGLLDMYKRMQCQANVVPAQHEDRGYFPCPIPVRWLETAAKLPGRSLHVGLLLWYVAGSAQSASVHLSNTLSLRFGVDRNAKYRALLSLEGAGLIAAKRRRGRSPLVTILQDSSAL